jgi:hypothetical protein
MSDRESLRLSATASGASKPHDQDEEEIYYKQGMKADV